MKRHVEERWGHRKACSITHCHHAEKDFQVVDFFLCLYFVAFTDRQQSEFFLINKFCDGADKLSYTKDLFGGYLEAKVYVAEVEMVKNAEFL